MALLPAADYGVDLADVIGRGLALTGLDVRGRTVLLKPNMVEYQATTAINTHPAVIAGAATAFLRAGARTVTVAEGPGHRRDTEYLLTATGLYDHLKDLRLRFVDLNLADVRMTPLRSRFMGLDQLAIPVDLLNTDIVVSMPKLKTHHWAVLTASMKNLFGTVPGAVYGWPKNVLHFHGIDNAILDLTATLRPQLTIVDAVVAMEGDGPIMGTAKPTGFIAMGRDLVAVDATCARVMGLDPAKVPYLAAAGEFLGHIDPARIDQRAERIERYRTPFEVLPQFRDRQLATGA